MNLYPPTDTLTLQDARDEVARLRKRLLSASAMLDECSDVLGNYEDVRDGERPTPNEAMSARMAIREWRECRV